MCGRVVQSGGPMKKYQMIELTADQQRNLDATVAAVQRIAMHIVTLPKKQRADQYAAVRRTFEESIQRAFSQSAAPWPGPLESGRGQGRWSGQGAPRVRTISNTRRLAASQYPPASCRVEMWRGGCRLNIAVSANLPNKPLSSSPIASIWKTNFFRVSRGFMW